MIWLADAVAAPAVYTRPSVRLAIDADPHLDYDLYSGQDTARLFYNAANAANADVVVVLGDLFGARKSDLDGDRDWDCTVDRFWTSTCPYPSPYLGQKYKDAAALWLTPERSHLVESGNHDGTPTVTTIGSLDSVDEWMRTWFPMEDQPCVVQTGREYTRCDLVVADPATGTSTVWTILLVPDQTSHQDRAIGGRCDLRDYSGLDAYRKGCSTRGWPVGVVTPYQIVWLETEIALASAEGRSVVVATHHPVPNTVALSGRGAAYVPQCSTGVYVQAADPAHHSPRDADLLPARTDLDTPIPGDPWNRTPLQAAHEHIGSVVRWYPGSSPDDSWGLDLVRRYPDTVRLWLSGHNHVPIPDLVDHEGRGMIYRDTESGTAFLAHGAGTRFWMTTSGTGHPQAALLDLNANGTWAWTRISTQTHGAGLAAHGCGGTAKLPPIRPAPWLDLPVETGP